MVSLLSKPKKSSAGTAKDGQLRIIGGSWRGRKLSFPAEQGLRPTGDRVRETLFNWLAPHINGARCADLFAGSGALGLEALSRGAAHCDFLDTSTTASKRLREHLATLGAGERGHCHACSAQQFLDGANGTYDIVFIDPPFSAGLVAPTCAQLDAAGVLGPHSLVYIESADHEPPPEVPPNWSLHRDKSAGDVAYRLYEVS
ncbi:MAG: 16S rRNA (guanine(966)-N(2))-methyltransferase RsmD [Halioglobus sp.]|nr:16S rRNA (guanine(966)-N(2))-methyltransferase RsmD [Halioglobus sp.]